MKIQENQNSRAFTRNVAPKTQLSSKALFPVIVQLYIEQGLDFMVQAVSVNHEVITVKYNDI